MPQPDEARRWSLVFRDRTTESEFQDYTARVVQHGYRRATLFVLVLWVLSYRLDLVTAGSPANLRWLLILRFAVGLPLVASSVGLGFMSVARFRRWKSLGALACAWGGLGIVSVMVVTIPEPSRYLGMANAGTSFAGIVLASALLALCGVRLDAVLAGFVAPVFALGLILPAGLADSPRAQGIFRLSLAMGLCVAAFCAWQIDRARRDAFTAWRAAARERKRADDLLDNMLPTAISARLKHAPGVIADELESVTVLFADIVGFTPFSTQRTAGELVTLLNDIFTSFDEMARRHGLEKIKTIGDAYMVVGGAPLPRADHAKAVAAMALEMRAAMAERADGLSLRIGMHSGPAVAGVIGASKYSYDLWGDTVNTASRMESHGAPGKVHVSDACRETLGDAFHFEDRGVVDIKGKGPMRTWWLRADAL